MGSAGVPLVVVVSVFGILAAFVPLLQAADPLCEGLPNGQIYPFPHEYNCSLFYECYNGNKTLNSCPGGLYYNPTTQSCDFPELSGCTNTVPSDCEGINLDYLPNPADCRTYVECYQGDAYMMSCPEGYYFDTSSKKCVPPAMSDCVTLSTPNPLCWGLRPNETHLYTYPPDCHLYYRCNGATLTVESCPPYLYFDEDRQLCDFWENIQCEGSPPTADPSTSTPPSTPWQEDPRCQDGLVSYWPHPVYCNMYIECYGFGSYEMNCPPGLYFSDAEKHCVPPGQSGCGSTETSSRSTVTFPTDWTSDPDCPYPEGEGWLYPYPGDCTKFYECAEGKKVAFDCPSNLWFNPVVNECDYAYQTDCPWGKLTWLERIYRLLFKK